MSDPVVVRARRDEAPAALLAQAGLAPNGARPVILLCGGARLADAERERAAALLGPALTTAARRTGAAVVDGGTDAGVMAIAGAARDQAGDSPSVLLGVAPAGLVEPQGDTPLAPHHTHFVLLDADQWGDETELMIGLANALANGGPVVALVAAGGVVTQAEVLAAARRGWPVIALKGTGGVADRLALGELAAGDVRVYDSQDPAALSGRLGWALQHDAALEHGWGRFATFDALAGRLRTSYQRLQVTILAVGILATLLALLHNALSGHWPGWLNDTLKWIVVALPIVVSVLMALANRRASGKRWVLLRAAAESIRSEIYRYRTRTPPYGDAAKRAAVLTDRVEQIVAQLMRTDASSGPLSPYAGAMPPGMFGASADDDGLSELDPERYLATRVGDQLRYYHAKITQLDRRRGVLQLLAIAAGGAGALVAAAGGEVWIGLTTAFTGAALTYLGDLQVDNTIVTYNQAAARLEALRGEWAAREPHTPEEFGPLVDEAENVLRTELGGWVEQMSEAIRKRTEAQSEEEES